MRFDNRWDHIGKLCADFTVPPKEPADVEVKITDAQIEAERAQSGPQYENGYLESICSYRTLCLQLPRYDALLVHSSVIDVDGRGVAFLGHSGLGKTTHTRLWLNMLGDRAKIVNGDKPIVRFFDGVPYAYGTPWAGKEDMKNNTRVPLTDLCFLERSPKNSTVSIAREDCAEKIMMQVLHPDEPEDMIKTLDLLDQLLQYCRLWTIRCNMEPDAAKTAYEAIFGR